jgi:hypothetical protein
MISKTCPALTRLLTVGPAFGRIRQYTASSTQVAGGTHELEQIQWQDSRMLRVKLSLTLEDLKGLIAAELNLMRASSLDLMAKVLLRVLLSSEEPWRECMLRQIISADYSRSHCIASHFPGTSLCQTIPYLLCVAALLSCSVTGRRRVLQLGYRARVAIAPRSLPRHKQGLRNFLQRFQRRGRCRTRDCYTRCRNRGSWGGGNAAGGTGRDRLCHDSTIRGHCVSD